LEQGDFPGDLQRFSSGVYSASLLPPRLPGDLNADGTVDSSDYALLQKNLGGVGGFTRGDLNATGAIDFKDLQLLEREFGQSGLVPLVGDTDGDGKVDRFDYKTVLGNQGKFGSAAQGDFNGDGAIDFADLQLLELNYGKTWTGTYTPFDPVVSAADLPAEFAAAGVPEPTSLALGALGGIMMLARRRRRD